MKSSLKEIKRLESLILSYREHLPHLDALGTIATMKYLSDAQDQLQKVQRAYDQKQARKKKKISPLRRAVLNEEASTPISEGGALPDEMDLDGSTSVGQIFTLLEFSFTNPYGGTGRSNWEFNPKFEGVAQVKVTQDWEDEETGHRYIGSAISTDLQDYLKAHGHPEDTRIFFSEFEIQKLNAHARKMKKRSSLGYHMASFNFQKEAEVGLIDAGDIC